MKNTYLTIALFIFTTSVFAQDEDFKKRHEAFGSEYAMAMQGPGAALAAKWVLDQGGNVFDAAVAASFSQSVERPQSTGIGGGGFMLIYSAKDQKTYALDFREVAPIAATEKMFLDDKGEVIPNKSDKGIFSAAVPGMVAGLVEVHEKFGKLPFSKLLEPSIKLAEKGAIVSKHMYDKLVSEKEVLMKCKDMKIFYHKDGTPLQVGEKFIQKNLAKTLRKIQKEGRKGFYEGSVRDAWIKTSKDHGGNMQADDFAKYQAKYRTPVEGTYNDLKIVSMPAPSSGGIHAIQILDILDPYDLKKDGVLAPMTVHRVSSAMQEAFMDRFFYLGDSDFVDVPVKMLLSKEHIDQMRSRIKKNKASASKDLMKAMPMQESTETAHFSIMDQDGNAVSATESVNAYFGAGLMAEGTGVIMNDTMDDFAIKTGATNAFGAIGGLRNKIGPGKRPVSSMAPTILFDKDGKTLMTLGTPDGQRIIPCLVLTILNYSEFKMSLPDSIAAVRYFNQWEPDEIRVDSPGFSPELTKSLESMGHKVTPKDFFCKIQAVAREGEQLHALSDLRGLESEAVGK